MGTTRNRRTAAKKYAKLAHTSVLAISMGLSMGPVSMQAAGEADTQTAEPEVLPTAYSSPQVYQGDSVSYFKNQFLTKSSFRSLASGEEAPTAANVSISGFAQVGKVLTGTYTYADVDGDTESGSIYTWYRADDSQGTNLSPISGAVTTTYTLTADDLGKYISFQVKPQNTAVNGNAGIAVKSGSTAAIAVAAAAPTAASVGISGFAQVGATLSGSYLYGDVNGDPELGSRYKWYRSDDLAGVSKTEITGATGTTYVLTAADLGKYIIFEVQPRNEFEDGIGQAVASEPTAAIAAEPGAPAAPTAANVGISGFAQVGSTLTGSYLYDDVNGDPELGSRYKWYRSDDLAGASKTEITGATGTTYVLTAADLGKYIIFEVQPRNEFEDGIGQAAASEPTAAIAAAPAAPTATQVGISGFAQVGSTLTGSYLYGDVNGDPELGSRYKWYRSDDLAGASKTEITGATGTTYVLTAADLGKYIIFEVQPRNEFEDGVGQAAASEPTAAIAAAPAAPTATQVGISGFAQVGATLSGSYLYGDVNGDPELGSRYKWYRSDDLAGASKTEITGATGTTYVLTAADLGKYIIFEVQPRNEFEDGIGQAAASEPTAAIAAAPAAPTAANVVIGGSAVVGGTLTGSYTYGDVNGDPELGSTYQWYRSADALGSGKAEIPGATGTTYVLTADDLGKYITFAVTPKNEIAPSTGSLSASEPTAAVINPTVEVQVPASPVATATPAPVAPAVQEEEVLIEVVAVKKNDESINSAKLTLTKNAGGIEQASFRFLTAEVIKAAQLASNKETMAVRVKTLKDAQTVYGEITGDALAALIAKQQRLAVITGDVAIEFPSVSIPVQELAKQGGVSADQLKLEIRIEKQPEAVKTAASQWAASQNASLIGEPYKFSINVLSGTLSTPVIQYGNRYAYHTVPIPAGITNPYSLGAVMLLDGKYVPVPVRVIDSEHAVIQTPTNATVMLIQRNQTFTDLSRHWGVNDLVFMADKDNVEGAADGSFNPGGSVSRGELASILVRSLGLGQRPVSAADNGSFRDLPADPSAVRDIQLAIGAGLFNGYSDTVFAPDAEVTREQLIAVLMRFYKNFELELPAVQQGSIADSYKDNTSISRWAEQYLNEAYQGGVVFGYENDTLGVTRAVTRDEATAMIRRFLQRTNLTN